jgi:hypothetical protein
MNVDTADFEFLPRRLPTDWAMRVVIRGSGFEQTAIPIVAEIGAQRILGLMPDYEQDGVVGFLMSEPLPGEQLKIGYADQPLIETAVTYQPPIA